MARGIYHERGIGETHILGIAAARGCDMFRESDLIDSAPS